MGQFIEFYLKSPPKFHPPTTCDCPKLRARPEEPTGWPWKIRNSRELFAFVDGLGDQVLESMIVFYLTDDLSLLAVDCFSDGSPSEVTVPIGRILCQARGLGATAIILLHNHPSGNTKPSEADIRLTRRVEAAADAMNITLLDHFVMGRISFRSIEYM